MRSNNAAKKTSAGHAALEKLQEYSARELERRKIERRAIEAAIWGMPLVAFDAMRQAFLRDAEAKYNDIVFWSKPADWKFQIATPNASSYYVYIAINVKDGPVVLELPPAIDAGLFGSLNDAWQAPQIDVGPAGEDKGQGGKYLLLPPFYNQTVPTGFIPVPFNTYNGYSILRVIPASSEPADVAKALDLVKRIRVYSLSEAVNPPPQRHIDMAGKLFDGIVRFDERFYESLARIVEDETVQERDLVAMGALRSIGIGKGKVFKPNADHREILGPAIAEAHACFMQCITEGEDFWPGAYWAAFGESVGPKTQFLFETGDRLEIDERAAIFFLCCAPPKNLGEATFYLLGAKDGQGVPLQGGKTYRLRVPANVPAKQFWAVTVYDLETAAFIRQAPRVEISSYDQKMRRNVDGSVDIFFGPSPPIGKQANWVYTAPGKKWVSLFRFYGPEKSLFEKKTWRLPDFQPVQLTGGIVLGP